LVAATGERPTAKVGWTDAATFAGIGVPATNFGPGDPLLAHTSSERVSRAELEKVYAALENVLADD
jgi:succinyl-diaminopimelate desuccinylase